MKRWILIAAVTLLVVAHPPQTSAGTGFQDAKAVFDAARAGKAEPRDDGLADTDRALAMLKPPREQADASGLSVGARVRLVAANTFIAVPSFSNRRADGRRLVRDIIANEGFSRAPAAFRISALELALSSSTDTDVGRAAWQQQLSEIKRGTTVAREGVQ